MPSAEEENLLTERLSAYGPKIDDAVIGLDVVECEGWKNNILGNCFFPVGHVSVVLTVYLFLVKPIC